MVEVPSAAQDIHDLDGLREVGRSLLETEAAVPGRLPEDQAL
jgi:hypothetical protein